MCQQKNMQTHKGFHQQTGGVHQLHIQQTNIGICMYVYVSNC